MTDNEAIKELKEAIDCCTSGEEEYFKESLGMGILAIEEIQQYRAIGTVEELQEMKSGDFTEYLLNMGYTKGIKDGYEKAIDEFAKSLKTDYVNFDLYYILENNNIAFENTSLIIYQDMIDELAEQMKGVQNERFNQQTSSN